MKLSVPSGPEPSNVLAADYYETLSNVNRILHLRLDLENALKAIVSAISDIVSCDKAEVTILLSELDSFQFYVVESRLPLTILGPDSLIQRNGSAMGLTYTKREPCIRLNLQQNQDFVEDYSYCKEGLARMISLPLLIRGKCVGTFNIGSLVVSAPSQEEVAFLCQIATILGLLVDSEMEGFRSEGAGSVVDQRLPKIDISNNQYSTGGMVGQSKALKKVQNLARSVAPTDSNVLITGETGTGKELLARFIHDLSPRRNRDFIAINCAGLPAGLVESELFGHERGSFTGAVQSQDGLFRAADGGTLFLDEFGEL
ncbi:MAG: sigma 54-interacting transcriptional regulator, partial [Nitrospirales bacterium]